MMWEYRIVDQRGEHVFTGSEKGVRGRIEGKWWELGQIAQRMAGVSDDHPVSAVYRRRFYELLNLRLPYRVQRREVTSWKPVELKETSVEVLDV